MNVQECLCRRARSTVCSIYLYQCELMFTSRHDGLRREYYAAAAALTPHAMPCMHVEDSCSDMIRGGYVKHIEHVCAVVDKSLERLCHTCHAPMSVSVLLRGCGLALECGRWHPKAHAV